MELLDVGKITWILNNIQGQSPVFHLSNPCDRRLVNGVKCRVFLYIKRNRQLLPELTVSKECKHAYTCSQTLRGFYPLTPSVIHNRLRSRTPSRAKAPRTGLPARSPFHTNPARMACHPVPASLALRILRSPIRVYRARHANLMAWRHNGGQRCPVLHPLQPSTRPHCASRSHYQHSQRTALRCS